MLGGRQTACARARKRGRSAWSTAAVAALALTVFGAVSGVAQAREREGEMPLELVEQTNNAYNHDCFWAGPRGLQYGNLPNATPIQKANLYPGPHGTFFDANFEGIPKGTVITIHGRYPHSRYMSYSVVDPLPSGAVVSTDQHFADELIKPDAGSTNPFVVGADRTATNRSYTVRLIAENAPAEPEPNTLYLGEKGTGTLLLRVYVPDEGLDGTGGVGLPTYEAKLPEGETVSGARLCERLVTPLSKGTPPGMTLEQWLGLRKQPYANPPYNDAATYPATNPSKFEKFWNGNYTLAGPFFPPAVRAKIPYKEVDFGANQDTTYVTDYINRSFGPVYVVHGKMPQFPNTYHGAKTMEPWQVRDWSFCQDDAPPSGKAYDCLNDWQVPTDKNGNYTIVVSKEGDRPANASALCGVAWLNYGEAGEGIPAPYNRPDFGLLVMRLELENPTWPNNGFNVLAPGAEEEAVMGEYLPHGTYDASAEEFQQQHSCEAGDPGVPHLAEGAKSPNNGAFTLEWSASPDVEAHAPITYTLQHKNGSGEWTTVASGLDRPSYTFTSGAHEQEGAWSYRASAQEGATSTGNSPESGQVSVDTTPPTLELSCPATTVLRTKGVAATFTASDGQSGLATPASGSIPIATGTLGVQTVSETAKDNVGNETTKSCSTNVDYGFSRLIPPAGHVVARTRPPVAVRFHLTDALGYVTNATATLEVAPASGPEAGSYRPATSATNTGDQFEAIKAGNYLYSLATTGLSKGTWNLKVLLNDGTAHTTGIVVR